MGLCSASAAQAIGMAVHELATNAGKYCALSSAESLEINWSVEREQPGDEVFIMSWREQSAHPIAPPAKQGFGSSVISNMAEMSLGAKVALSFPSTGLTWELRCPADEVLDGGVGLVRDEERGKPTDGAALSWQSLRILVVEDEALVATEIAHVLTGGGFGIMGPARSVPMAFDLLKRFGCEAAVLDINLSRETSESVATELRAAETPFASFRPTSTRPAT